MSFLWTVRSDDFLVGYYAGLALLSTSPHLNKATAEIVELDIFAACEEMERRGIIVTFSTAQVRERYARFKLQEKIAGALYEHESNFGAKWADCDCVNTRDDYLESADAVLAVLPQGAEPDGPTITDEMVQAAIAAHDEALHRSEGELEPVAMRAALEAADPFACRAKERLRAINEIPRRY